MSSGLTTMRAALQAALTAALSSYTFKAGPPPSTRVPNDAALGYVWADRLEQDQSNKLLENVYCGVRMYPQYTQQLDPETPNDPTPLEQAAADLQTSLEPGQYSSDPWYYDVVSIELENDAGYLTAEIRGVRWNDAAVGA